MSLGSSICRLGFTGEHTARNHLATIVALEDKIVQGATVMVLSAIYEVDFCSFS